MFRTNLFFTFVALLAVISGNSQSENPLGFQIEAGYLVGGQVTSNSFAYQSGLSARATVLKTVSPSVVFGGGVGLDSYDYINFVPIYLMVEARSNPVKTGAFVAFFGYSFADEESRELINQEFEGGAFLEVGRSWKYDITSDLKLSFGLTLKHQFAISEVENLVGQELEEKADFDGLHFRLGISF